MKVAVMTGDPRLGCGVSDYSQRLAESLEAAGVDVELVVRGSWGPRAVGGVHRLLRRLRPDLVHLQYPTNSYRTSLAPHALALIEQPLVVTLHEATQANPLRQASLLALLARPRHVIFTTPHERDHVLRLARRLRSRSGVIPIGSAIPVAPATGERVGRVAYFGLLTPEKGLDDVLAVAQFARLRPGTRVLVVGRAEVRYPQLAAQLQARAADLPVDWALDRDAAEVAGALAASAVGYLPYPDGASERRSSLLALLVNGVATVTTPGEFVDDELAAAVHLAADPAAAWPVIERLLDDDRALAAAGERARVYGATRDWSHIADRHLEVYRAVLRERGGPPPVGTQRW